tara:strand:+ start:744 stop:1199 length:456 start_codon:yes stop_codon:yes gene_type:complete
MAGTLKIKRLTALAKLPCRGSSGAAGYDLHATSKHTIKPGERALISTGLSIMIPYGRYARIAPRSGLSVKNGIHVGAGVVDADYRGEIKVLLCNMDTRNDFEVDVGHRIAQMIIEHCDTPEIEDVSEIDDTARGTGGFGSTGILDETMIRA